MYYFNFSLFSKLNLLFGITQKELSIKLFGNKSRYGQKIESQDRIMVSDMVELCNTLCISISHFITLEENMYYRDKITEYVIDKQLFKPILFDNHSINNMYGKDGLAGNISQIEFSKKIGVSSASLYLWINQDTCTMKINNLLKMCNTFGVNIDNFITDENSPLPKNNVAFPKGNNTFEKQFEELIDLREVVTHQSQEIAQLKRDKKSLELSFKGYQVAEDMQMYFSGKNSIRTWMFHKNLLDNLPSLFQTSKGEFFKGFGMSNPSVSYNEGNITVQLLVAICNKYQLSTKHFFIRQNEKSEVIRELSFYLSDKFKYIQFHPEYIADIFGRNSLTDMSLEEVLNTLGYSEMKLRSWRNADKSTLRVNDLVELCNALNVTPSCFITDTNKTAVVYSGTQTEYFLEENRMLRQEVIRLKESLKQVKKKRK